MKNITVIGVGYVGLVSAVGLADFGNKVVGVDINPDRVNLLNKGTMPFFEKGIDEYLRRNLSAGRLSFTTEISQAIQNADVVMIAVGTPSNEDGTCNLSYVESAVDSVAQFARGYTILVLKSTVPVGTNRAMQTRVNQASSAGEIDVVSNPEFLREGQAIQDFFHPDRVVLGTIAQRACDIMQSIYRPLNRTSVPFVLCGLETAELIKYASNSFLATKISFINQMANLADCLNADIHQVASAMGMDGRINRKFLHPGPGYGGSCFPKDLHSLTSTGDRVGIDMSLLKSVSLANEAQKQYVAEKIWEAIGKKSGSKVAILGLAFKAETDDVRDSPALTVVNKLLQKGIEVQVHDPVAMDNFLREVPQAVGYPMALDAVENADALVLMTEWNEYRGISLKVLKEKMKGRIIYDTRNILNPEIVHQAGFIYHGMGRSYSR